MTAFSPRQMFTLDEACKPIAEAFDSTPYLVGTAATRTEYRDVDVRLILDDAKYARLVDAVGPDLVAFLGLVIGDYIAHRTGMPIDFQVQQQTTANALHDGPRNPLGIRTLDNYRGDAALEGRKPVWTSCMERDHHGCEPVFTNGTVTTIHHPAPRLASDA